MTIENNNPDPDAIHRVFAALQKAGWLKDGTVIRSDSEGATGTINFSKFGTDQIRAFYVIHDGLWEIDPKDFAVLHHILFLECLKFGKQFRQREE